MASQQQAGPSETPSQRPNRLIHESSPYLLQHAYNPVDWRPWGAEAFEEARRREVPILLSVGYSTCYWCHVMERECFENEAIGASMNAQFVCIKLDREERPDIDDAYMTALVTMTGQGGWPMNCFLDPHTLKPFWCGTYFPPEPAMGRPSWPRVLDALAAAWRDRREEVVGQSQSLAEAVAEQSRPSEPVAVGASHVSAAVEALLRIFDRQNGGFGRAPKFPQPVFLDLLLEIRDQAGDDATRLAIDEAVRRSLDRMACGGIFDQVGGGFHRYSVDEFWLVPHFEKMLYDNAQLAMVYLRGASLYGDSWYAEIARRVLDYVLAEMTDDGGGFYSAQDAEVDHREGLNYLWRSEEFEAALEEDAAFAKRVYGLDAGPNFRDPHHPDDPPRNVLRLDDRPAAVAGSLGVTAEEFAIKLARINSRLFEARKTRKQPHLDDKVITAWNGLMIGAMARASRQLAEPRYLRSAVAAATFILTHMRREDGSLLRVHRAGRSQTAAVLEDYAFLASGLIEIHRANGSLPGPIASKTPAAWAEELLAVAARLFKDRKTSLYSDSMAGSTDLFVRMRSTHDGALPSASSVLLHTFIDLAEITGNERYHDEAIRLLASMSGAINASPVGSANGVRGLYRLLRSTPDRVRGVVGETEHDPATQETATDAGHGFMPVEIYADQERLTIGRDRPAKLNLILRIAPGYHLIAADPGPGGSELVPLRVGVIGGSGLAAYADYPAGEPYGVNQETRIYSGQIEMPVAIEMHGEWHGRPLLGVTFQACSDTECQMPMTVELDVAIDCE